MLRCQYIPRRRRRRSFKLVRSVVFERWIRKFLSLYHSLILIEHRYKHFNGYPPSDLGTTILNSQPYIVALRRGWGLDVHSFSCHGSWWNQCGRFLGWSQSSVQTHYVESYVVSRVEFGDEKEEEENMVYDATIRFRKPRSRPETVSRDTSSRTWCSNPYPSNITKSLTRYGNTELALHRYTVQR